MLASTHQQKTNHPFLGWKGAIEFIIKIVSIFLFFNIFSGCAVYYRDRETGAEHIWGFGHLAVKTIPPSKGKQALIQKMTLTGVAVGVDNGSFGVSVGYDAREHILIYDENTAITIKRPPSNDPFYFKIGTYPSDLENTAVFNPYNSCIKKELEP